MKMVDINKAFTEKVAQYIVAGYIINVKTMGGSQGEEGKVDLVKGDEVIRIWLDRESARFTDYRNPEKWHGSYYALRVSKWNHPASALNSWTTIWMNELTHIEEIFYYEIRQDRWYVDTLEEALELQNIQHDRMTIKYNKELPARPHTWITTQQEIGAKYLKRKIGYKRVRNGDIFIQKIEDRGCYSLMYKGNVYYIQ